MELGMWNMLGDYLDGSALTADSFLKSSHLLQQQVFQLTHNDESNFEGKKMIKKCPTFQYWDTILAIELLILTFVRAHHEKNFSLFVEAYFLY